MSLPNKYIRHLFAIRFDKISMSLTSIPEQHFSAVAKAERRHIFVPGSLRINVWGVPRAYLVRYKTVRLIGATFLSQLSLSPSLSSSHSEGEPVVTYCPNLKFSEAPNKAEKPLRI